MIVLESVPVYIRVSLTLGWYAFIYYLTELPSAAPNHSLGYISDMTSPAIGQIGDPQFSKNLYLYLPDFLNFIFRSFAHMFVFGIQGILLYFLFKPTFVVDKKTFWLVCLFFIGILGWMDELHQGHVPGRTPRFVDVVKDCVGALVFVAATIRIKTTWQLRRQAVINNVS